MVHYAIMTRKGREVDSSRALADAKIVAVDYMKKNSVKINTRLYIDKQVGYVKRISKDKYQFVKDLG